MSCLFTPLRLRQLDFKNRIFVSPMCQYSAINGIPNTWHLVHLGSRAVGGAALIIVEATSVSPEGRISPGDLGLWNDEQEVEFLKINNFIKAQGSIAGIQIAHAGRKAGTPIPWNPHSQSEDWLPLAPSEIPFSNKNKTPKYLTEEQIQMIHRQFISAAERSLRAGFEVIEIHMAHGYLFHEFLSPLSNQRQDQYGGSFENRIRFPLQVAQSIRGIWPKNLPVFVRVSATDWVEPHGWTLKDSILFCKYLKNIGIDFIDCSSGGNISDAQIPTTPNYQVQFATAIKNEVQIPTGAVGLITDPHQAEQILIKNQADAILIGREFLRDPYWPLHAAKQLNTDMIWPKQYLRAKL